LLAEKYNTAVQTFGFMNTNGLCLQVNITPTQGADFTGTESAVEHQDYPGTIYWGRDNLKQCSDLTCGQVARQRFTHFQRADFQHDFANENAITFQVAQKRLNDSQCRVEAGWLDTCSYPHFDMIKPNPWSDALNTSQIYGAKKCT
jgi:hypothetical protein